MASCSHLDQVRAVQPGTPAGCEECLAMGDTWVHLRECLSCGHVGCCDSSKNRHATAHFRTTGHPLMRSFQPGENWAWCYLDEVMLQPAPSARRRPRVDVQEVLEVLRRMDMLSEFTPEQLRWVAEHGVVVDIPAGQMAMRAGDAEAGFWLLMDGTVSVARPDDDGKEMLTGTTDHLGSWGGRIPLTGEPSPITLRADTDARFLRLSDDDADTMLASGMPLGRHLIAGIQMGTRRFEARLRERERLASLGRMSAGLSHELNNPAAAIARAAAQLRAAILDSHRLSMKVRVSPETKQQVMAAGEDLTSRIGSSDSLSGLARADAEEEVADWLEQRGVDEAWDAAPVLVESGADVAWLEKYLGAVPAEELRPAVGVLTSAATTTQLTLEIEQASARISALVSSVKTYTNMDGEGRQDIDVRKGLKSTLTMLSHKLKHYQVTVDWPAEIPTVPANPGELNQVWTNLLDNAADALAERAGSRLG